MNFLSGSWRYSPFFLLGPDFILVLFQNKNLSREGLLSINFLILLLLAFWYLFSSSIRAEIASGDNPLSRLFSTYLVRAPSMATLLHSLFLRYCLKKARR